MTIKPKTINKGALIRGLVMLAVGIVPLSFLVMSTAINVIYGLGISIMAGTIYGIFGVGEVALGVLSAGATRRGKVAAVAGLFVLIGISLFTSLAVKHSERYAINADAKNISGLAESSQLASSAALKTLTLAQSNCEQITAEYNSFEPGTRAANRRKTEKNTACNVALPKAQAAYDASVDNASESSGKLIAKEDAVYHMLEDYAPVFSADKWANVIFLINSIALCFGCIVFSYVWSNQRDNSYFKFGKLPATEKDITRDGGDLEAWAQEVLERYKPSAELPQLKAALAAIPMTKDDSDCYLMPATINGIKCKDMVFDTGASKCLISAETASKLNLGDVVSIAQMSTANGTKEQVSMHSAVISIGQGVEVETVIAVSQSCAENLFAPSCLNGKYDWSIDGNGVLTVVIESKSKSIVVAASDEYTDNQLDNARKRISNGNLKPTVASLTSKTAKSNWRLRIGKKAASMILARLADEGLLVSCSKTGGYKLMELTNEN